MSNTAFATIQDIETLWRPLTASEQSRAEAMLPLVSDELRVLAKNAGKDLDQFIGFFLLTKDNVNKYNIHALLADHIITNNVEDIFDGTAPIRKDNFTQDVVRIAFRENKGTTNNCSYIDVRENSIWPYEYSNLFFDLNEYESQPISNDEIDDILECFDKNGVFSMKSKAYNSNYITDPVSFTLVIEYSDGTRFVLSRSGSPEKVYPKNYDEWRDMLFR